MKLSLSTASDFGFNEFALHSVRRGLRVRTWVGGVVRLFVGAVIVGLGLAPFFLAMQNLGRVGPDVWILVLIGQNLMIILLPAFALAHRWSRGGADQTLVDLSLAPSGPRPWLAASIIPMRCMLLAVSIPMLVYVWYCQDPWPDSYELIPPLLVCLFFSWMNPMVMQELFLGARSALGGLARVFLLLSATLVFIPAAICGLFLDFAFVNSPEEYLWYQLGFGVYYGILAYWLHRGKQRRLERRIARLCGGEG